MELEAQAAINRADYLVAADHYLSLAEQAPDKAVSYRLKAAAAFFQANDTAQAEQVLATVTTDEQPIENLQKTVLLAKIRLAQGDARAAIERLSITPPGNTPQHLLGAYHQTRAEAFDQLGLRQDELKDRLALSHLTETAVNDKALWQSLSEHSADELTNLRSHVGERGLAWVELALLYQAHISNTRNLQAVINDWQARYPGHRAITSVIPELIEASVSFSSRPANIAVLLPMSGRFRDASRAIRDGLMAAWHQGNDNKSNLRFYNTDSLNVVENYQRAINEGAEFVIGPLEKPAIETLLLQTRLEKPTLVLNYYDGNVNDISLEQVQPGKNFFQFALSPENEAEQVAERAMFDGHIRALAITTGDEWGSRLLQAFQQRWQQLGGVLLEATSYTDETEDLSEPIRKLLNTDESKQRAQELRATLNRSIHSEERRRQDADFIFIASRPAIARQVMPHIRFLRAADIPVYATSHIYTGQPNPVRDADMNHIRFADIPWNLNPDYDHVATKTVINNNWPALAGQYERLYALGYDAYAVIPSLATLATDPSQRFNGATGDLYIAEQGKLQRYLTWAQFIDGTPQVSVDATP